MEPSTTPTVFPRDSVSPRLTQLGKIYMNTNLMTLEGRLNAHRKLLVSLVALLDSVPEARETIQRMRMEQETHRDHEEDPGIEPDETYAVQRIAAQEIMDIIGAGIKRSASEHRRQSGAQLELGVDGP
jgi:hypothetical protein